MKIKFNTRINYLLFIILIIFFTITYLYIFLNISLPNFSDEFFYTRSSESFVKNKTLHGAFTYNGEGAIVFGSDVHGFAYPFIIGILMKIIGWNSYSIIIFNLVFLVLSLFVVFVQRKFTIEKKLLMSSLLLLSLNIVLFSFTYLPETLNVLIAIILFFLIYSYSISKSRKKKLIILFIILVGGLFRATWLIYSVVFLPFSESKKSLLQNTLIFIFFLFFGFVYTKLLMEPWVDIMYRTSERIMGGEILQAILGFGYHFVIQAFRYLTPNEEPALIYLIYKYINIIAVIFFIYIGLNKSNKLFIAFGISLIIHHFLLFSLHGIHGYGGIRHLFPSFLFFAFTLVIFSNQYLKLRNVLIVIILSLFPFGIIHTYKWINNRISYSQSFIKSDCVEVYNKIGKFVQDDSIQTVFIDYIEYSNSFSMNAVPLVNKNKAPLRYIMRYYPNKFNPDIIDYILTKPGVKPGTFKEINILQSTLVFESEYYDLYKVNKLK